MIGAGVFILAASSSSPMSGELLMFILGAAFNGMLVVINIAWTLASKRGEKAEANKDTALDEKFSSVLAEIRRVRDMLVERDRRQDIAEKHIEKLRERDAQIELRVAEHAAAMNAKLDTFLGVFRPSVRDEEGKRA